MARLTPEQRAQARAEGERMAELGIPATPSRRLPRAPKAPNPWEEHGRLLLGVGALAGVVVLLFVAKLLFGGSPPETPDVARSDDRRRTELPALPDPSTLGDEVGLEPGTSQPPPVTPDPPEDPPKEPVTDEIEEPPPSAHTGLRPPPPDPPPAQSDPPVVHQPPDLPPEQPVQVEGPPMIVCSGCQGTTRVRCRRCRGTGGVMRSVATNRPCPKCNGKKTRQCKKVHCRHRGHRYHSVTYGTDYYMRYECEPDNWNRPHSSFTCKGHVLICNWCGNSGKDPGKVRRSQPCTDCSATGRRICRRCNGKGELVKRVADPAEHKPTHELRLKSGVVHKGSVVASTEQIVMFRLASGKRKIFKRELIASVLKLPDEDEAGKD